MPKTLKIMLTILSLLILAFGGIGAANSLDLIDSDMASALLHITFSLKVLWVIWGVAMLIKKLEE